MRMRFCTIAALVCMYGCSALEVDSVGGAISEPMCVIENRSTSDAFLLTLMKRVSNNGYMISIAGEGVSCSSTLQYEAKYGIDAYSGNYLSSATISLHQESKEIGQVYYRRSFLDSDGPSHIKSLIEMLVDKLLPPKGA